MSLKFIGDMIHYNLLDLQIADDMLSTLFEINHNHIDFLNLGKIVIIFCTLGNKIYNQSNPNIQTMFT